MKDGSTHLSTWVSADTKQRFSAVARQQSLSESALLRRIVGLVLTDATGIAAHQVDCERGSRAARLTVRVHADDRLLLRERALARSMPAATYVAVLVRAHLRTLAPLPTAELGALRNAIGELGAARAALHHALREREEGGHGVGPTREDLKAILRACEALRDHFAGLLQANLKSWEGMS